MITSQRLFDIYRKLAHSFDAYYRNLTYHQQIKGMKKLEKALKDPKNGTKLL